MSTPPPITVSSLDLERVERHLNGEAARRMPGIDALQAELARTADPMAALAVQRRIEIRHLKLLEDFKLRHRYEDLRRVHGEVARAELENLRLAARIMKGELENPVVERRILVEGKPAVTSDV